MFRARSARREREKDWPMAVPYQGLCPSDGLTPAGHRPGRSGHPELAAAVGGTAMRCPPVGKFRRRGSRVRNSIFNQSVTVAVAAGSCGSELLSELVIVSCHSLSQ